MKMTSSFCVSPIPNQRISSGMNAEAEVARERDERLEERFDGLVRAHRDPQGHRDHGGKDEAADHAPDGDRDVLGEAVLREQRPSFPEHGQRVGEKGLRHETPEGGEAPGADEQHEEQDAQRGLAAGRDGLQRSHAGSPREVT
jgi:hypothetical protein